ncbi:MAG: hypothetical protein HWE20_14490 [Gammaproteobacteria bacterium]|nr:hypothetical protein [Gammaproteobacteria bacterium]
MNTTQKQMLELIDLIETDRGVPVFKFWGAIAIIGLVTELQKDLTNYISVGVCGLILAAVQFFLWGINRTVERRTAELRTWLLKEE